MELSFKYRFEAAHRFTHGTTKCTTPHGHSWWLELSIEHSPKLIKKETNLAWDFADLKQEWKSFIDGCLDHSFFCNSEDPLIEPLMKIHGDARILKTPGDPTTEMLGLLFFSKAEVLFKRFEGVEVSKVKVFETPTNSVTISKDDFQTMMTEEYEAKNKWWTHEDPLFRD